MTKEKQAVLVCFLQECSDDSLADFVLARLNRDAQLRKQLQALQEEIIENRGWYLTASLLRQHGAALRRRAATAQSIPSSVVT